MSKDEGGTTRELDIRPGPGIPGSKTRLLGNSVHPTRVSSIMLHAIVHELIHTKLLIVVLKTKAIENLV